MFLSLVLFISVFNLVFSEDCYGYDSNLTPLTGVLDRSVDPPVCYYKFDIAAVDFDVARALCTNNFSSYGYWINADATGLAIEGLPAEIYNHSNAVFLEANFPGITFFLGQMLNLQGSAVDNRTTLIRDNSQVWLDFNRDDLDFLNVPDDLGLYVVMNTSNLVDDFFLSANDSDSVTNIVCSIPHYECDERSDDPTQCSENGICTSSGCMCNDDNYNGAYCEGWKCYGENANVSCNFGGECIEPLGDNLIVAEATSYCECDFTHIGRECQYPACYALNSTGGYIKGYLVGKMCYQIFPGTNTYAEAAAYCLSNWTSIAYVLDGENEGLPFEWYSPTHLAWLQDLIGDGTISNTMQFYTSFLYDSNVHSDDLSDLAQAERDNTYYRNISGYWAGGYPTNDTDNVRIALHTSAIEFYNVLATDVSDFIICGFTAWSCDDLYNWDDGTCFDNGYCYLGDCICDHADYNATGYCESWWCGDYDKDDSSVCGGSGHNNGCLEPTGGAGGVCDCDGVIWKGTYCDVIACDGESEAEGWCNDRGECVEWVNYCECDLPYGGDFCEVVGCYGFAPDDPDVCHGNGNCTVNGTDSVCECENHYSGPDCSMFKCGAYYHDDPRACSHHGNCIDYDDCTCDFGYDDEDDCSTWTCNGTATCENSGTCIDSEYCVCNFPYTTGEDDCTHYSCFDDCNKYNSYGDFGTCIGPGVCNCTGEVTGDYCEELFCGAYAYNDDRVCGDTPSSFCQRNGECYCDVDTGSSGTWGYTGSVCQTLVCNTVPDTNSSICANHGDCIENEGSGYYTECECDTGYNGGGDAWCNECDAYYYGYPDCVKCFLGTWNGTWCICNDHVTGDACDTCEATYDIEDGCDRTFAELACIETEAISWDNWTSTCICLNDSSNGFWAGDGSVCDECQVGYYPNDECKYTYNVYMCEWEDDAGHGDWNGTMCVCDASSGLGYWDGEWCTSCLSPYTELGASDCRITITEYNCDTTFHTYIGNSTHDMCVCSFVDDDPYGTGNYEDDGVCETCQTGYTGQTLVDGFFDGDNYDDDPPNDCTYDCPYDCGAHGSCLHPLESDYLANLMYGEHMLCFCGDYGVTDHKYGMMSNCTACSEDVFFISPPGLYVLHNFFGTGCVAGICSFDIISGGSPRPVDDQYTAMFDAYYEAIHIYTNIGTLPAGITTCADVINAADLDKFGTDCSIEIDTNPEMYDDYMGEHIVDIMLTNYVLSINLGVGATIGINETVEINLNAFTGAAGNNYHEFLMLPNFWGDRPEPVIPYFNIDHTGSPCDDVILDGHYAYTMSDIFGVQEYIFICSSSEFGDDDIDAINEYLEDFTEDSIVTIPASYFNFEGEYNFIFTAVNGFGYDQDYDSVDFEKNPVPDLVTSIVGDFYVGGENYYNKQINFIGDVYVCGELQTLDDLRFYWKQVTGPNTIDVQYLNVPNPRTLEVLPGALVGEWNNDHGYYFFFCARYWGDALGDETCTYEYFYSIVDGFSIEFNVDDYNYIYSDQLVDIVATIIDPHDSAETPEIIWTCINQDDEFCNNLFDNTLTQSIPADTFNELDEIEVTLTYRKGNRETEKSFDIIVFADTTPMWTVEDESLLVYCEEQTADFVISGDVTFKTGSGMDMADHGVNYTLAFRLPGGGTVYEFELYELGATVVEVTTELVHSFEVTFSSDVFPAHMDWYLLFVDLYDLGSGNTIDNGDREIEFEVYQYPVGGAIDIQEIEIGVFSSYRFLADDFFQVSSSTVYTFYVNGPNDDGFSLLDVAHGGENSIEASFFTPGAYQFGVVASNYYGYDPLCTLPMVTVGFTVVTNLTGVDPEEVLDDLVDILDNAYTEEEVIDAIGTISDFLFENPDLIDDIFDDITVAYIDAYESLDYANDDDVHCLTLANDIGMITDLFELLKTAVITRRRQITNAQQTALDLLEVFEDIIDLHNDVSLDIELCEENYDSMVELIDLWYEFYIHFADVALLSRTTGLIEGITLAMFEVFLENTAAYAYTGGAIDMNFKKYAALTDLSIVLGTNKVEIDGTITTTATQGISVVVHKLVNPFTLDDGTLETLRSSKVVTVAFYENGAVTTHSSLASNQIIVEFATDNVAHTVIDDTEDAGNFPFCYYYDTTAGAWANTGCVHVSHTTTTTTCACNHATSFAVFIEEVEGVDDDDGDDDDDGGLSVGAIVGIVVGSVVGVAILIVIIVVAIIVVLYFFSAQKKKKTIHPSGDKELQDQKKDDS